MCIRDSSWNAYPNQWKVLWRKPRVSVEFVEIKLKEWSSCNIDTMVGEETDTRDKPWEKAKAFNGNDVDGKLNITLSNGIYIDCLNLKPAIQNKIRRMAAIRNPIYYKNQAIGTCLLYTSK